MKVVTVKSKEVLPAQTQRDIHYTLRMEHQSDYVFRDIEDGPYSATISIEDPSDTVQTVIQNTKEIPEHTIQIDIVDLEENSIERITVLNGEVKEKKSGSWEWQSGE